MGGLHHVLVAARLDGQLAVGLTDLLNHAGDEWILGGIGVGIDDLELDGR